jgi:imidazole glycerol-phosphate synthase subunit HisH
MNPKIKIINTRAANLVSVKNAFNYIGFDVDVTTDPEALNDSTHLVLPGVGSFDSCLDAIDAANLRETIKTLVLKKKTPIIGICVGMQALFESSEEGSSLGLGFLKGRCVSLKPAINGMYKVPHNGFTNVRFSPKSCLNLGLQDSEAFYFNHSYGILELGKPAVVDWTKHTQNIVASFQWQQIFGVQFHPEKSQRTGLKVLSNFINNSFIKR